MAAHQALGGPGLVPGDGLEGLPFYNAIAALTWAGDLEAAEEALDPALEEAERCGRVMIVATASFRRAAVAYLRGAVAKAVADAQRAVDAARFGWAAYLPAARGILALALIELGELLRAAAALDPADPPHHGGRSTPEAIFRHARSCLHLVEGAGAEALEEALAAGRIMTEELGSLTPAIVPWRSAAATAHSRLGDRAEARRLAAEEVELARAFGAPRPLGVALRVQGAVEGTQGVELLRESADTLAASPARLEQARALAELGGALRRAGRRTEASGVLQEGLQLAERCGSVALAERLQQELRASGVRSRRRAREGPAALTPGEERVARLAADGLTNKEIAQKLFVSVRAVEFHLRNAYAKLGISSRQELAAALGEA